MNSQPEHSAARANWFVGASYGGMDDQTSRFLADGIWENGYEDRYLELVQSMRPGDRIAIKSSYTRKHELPFNNRGHTVSVMAIKAVGTITENVGDGRRIRVDWQPADPPREWYFYTWRSTIWRVSPGKWETDGLLRFTFDGEEQDIDRFRNAPYWHERFGDVPRDKQRFAWVTFYEAVAEKVLGFKNDRSKLVEGIHDIAGRVEGVSHLRDQFADGTRGPLKDICPFTAMGIFNRGLTDANRKIIAGEFAKLLGVDEPVPNSFEGIPVLNNQRSWFFGYASGRQPDDIDVLWEVFAAAERFARSEDPEARPAFMEAYDEAIQRWGVAWNLSTGLYWAHPWDFPTLDKQSRSYITGKLGIPIPPHTPQGACNAETYLKLKFDLDQHFEEPSYPVHSYPEMSLAAWHYRDPVEREQSADGAMEPESDGPIGDLDSDRRAAIIEPYSVDAILADGCFLDRGQLDMLLDRLRAKKNLILQGPPGTGKSWLARRLAFALMGEKDESKLRAVQFHANLSYEDFVRGWRPSGDGTLALADGVFMQIVSAAMKEPSETFVIVIEEINRGNPAQIFGEMLTLLEADKRTPNEALELSYVRQPGERVSIPDNLYVIGTMNIADRSLALVDFALRRRFAFADLEPRFGDPWREWVVGRYGIEPALAADIERRIVSLNETIAADPNLGSQFRIGHSYVTPPLGARIDDAREWFRQVVETEIGPLLGEYWYEPSDKSRAEEEKRRLVDGL